MPKPERWETKTQGTRYRVRFRQDGVHRSRTFSTKPEAQQLCDWIKLFGLERALAELDAQRNQADEMTLDAWAVRHFDSLTGVTPGTLSTYRRVYARTWSPRLGHLRLSQISREQLARTVNEIQSSDKTVKNAWGILATMLKVAVIDGHLPRSPALGVKLPRRTAHLKVEHRYLTHDEWWDLLDATPAHWQPFVWMLAGTGMRWGEAVALNVGDIDLEHATVRINKAEKWDVADRGKRLVGPTKTGRSTRTVTLPPEVIDAVRPLVEGRKSTDTLFLAPKGGTVQHRTFYSDIWRKKCCAPLPTPHPRIHDLRHSHVAWLIGANVQGGLATIQARLGHEKITTTIDTYGHLMPDIQRAAADAASRVLGRRPNTPLALD
jgi:integrase